MPNPSYPGPISSSILDDFQAPPEATKPLQDQLVRIRQAYGALDGAWLRLRLMLEKSVTFEPYEQALITAFEQSSVALNLAILNRPAEVPADQEPAKGSQSTY